MSKNFDWGLPSLMLGFGVLGFVLATAVVKREYQERILRQQVDHQLSKAKAHMTTILQLNDCHINEAFYTLDRAIFEIDKALNQFSHMGATGEYAERANKTIADYYARFGIERDCEDCVPRSPIPAIHCNANRGR